jgi:hypothetical protein
MLTPKISGGLPPSNDPLPRMDPIEDKKGAKVQSNDEKCQELWAVVKERFDNCIKDLVQKARNNNNPPS